MAHLTHVVPGEPFKPAAGDWNAFVDTARTVRDQRVIFKPGDISYSNEPQLFIALETFSLSSGGSEVCQGAKDARVGRSAKLDWDVNLYDGFGGWPISYQRVMGEAVCVWQPAESGCSSVNTEIKCGEYFWGIWNGQSGRYEALSNGRHDSDATNDGSACPCKWYGYALWKVVVTDDVAAWVLDENHCSGCYDATESREVIAVDHRFEETNLNDDWIETPGADPEDYRADNPDGRHDETFRYVTCCNITDDPPPPPCDLTCCYSVPVPLPSCSDPTSVSQVILQAVTGNAVCSWASGPLSYAVWNDSWPESEHGCPDSTPDITYSITMTLTSVVMSTTQIIYSFSLLSTGFTGAGWVTVIYNLNATPDCTNDPTATKAAFQTNVNNYTDCTFCERNMGWLSSLFPATITATRITCNETTTTNTSTSSTTTVSSTTSTSSTTGSTSSTSSTTASSTTGSTTTSSSTTASSTTGSTTGSTSSTTAACTGTCDYTSWAIGTGSPTGWYWLLASSNCSSGCGCPAGDNEEAVAIGRWPVDGSDTASISCR